MDAVNQCSFPAGRAVTQVIVTSYRCRLHQVVPRSAERGCFSKLHAVALHSLFTRIVPSQSVFAIRKLDTLRPAGLQLVHGPRASGSTPHFRCICSGPFERKPFYRTRRK
jgi:hypothetical protein